MFFFYLVRIKEVFPEIKAILGKCRVKMVGYLLGRWQKTMLEEGAITKELTILYTKLCVS